MTLDKLQNDMIQAMKNGNKTRKNVLSGVIGAIKNAAIAKRCRDNITEDLVNEVILKEKKTIQEQINTCPSDRLEKLQEFLSKKDILEEYCPKLLDNPDEIKSIIQRLCSEGNAPLTKSNRSAIMKIVMPYFKGKADMKVVNAVIESELK